MTPAQFAEVEVAVTSLSRIHHMLSMIALGTESAMKMDDVGAAVDGVADFVEIVDTRLATMPR